MYIMNADPLPVVKIVDIRSGKEVYSHEVPYPPHAPVHGQFRRFRMTSEGTFLAPYLSLGKAVEYDRDFHVLWEYPMDGCWAAIRLKNGNTLVTGEKGWVHREVDGKGRTVWQIAPEDIPEPYRPLCSQTCVRLDNGNTIICSMGRDGKGPQLVEVSPEKEVVWVIRDWKQFGPCTAVQILDDGGVPEEPGACQR